MLRTAYSLLQRALGKSARGYEGFNLNSSSPQISGQALEVARAIRGPGHPPAIIIHGVMPRSGTVYTGEVLRLHTHLHAYPNDLWEVPFLELTGDIQRVQRHFFAAYRQNIDKMGSHDFLPLFGSSLIAYLHSFVPTGKRLLLKVPDVQFLDRFFAVFPYENLLLLMRDGRDVVSSTIKSWPGRKFAEVCTLWDKSARTMLHFQKRHAGEPGRVMSVKYEDVVGDPEGFALRACDVFGLDRTAFHVEKIRDLPVRGSSNVVAQKTGQSSWNPVEKTRDFISVGRWKDWTPAQKRTFKRIAGQTLIETGYCRDLEW